MINQIQLNLSKLLIILGGGGVSCQYKNLKCNGHLNLQMLTLLVVDWEWFINVIEKFFFKAINVRIKLYFSNLKKNLVVLK